MLSNQVTFTSLLYLKQVDGFIKKKKNSPNYQSAYKNLEDTVKHTEEN